MSTETQKVQSLLDGELADADLEAVAGGGRKHGDYYCYYSYKKHRWYCYYRR